MSSVILPELGRHEQEVLLESSGQLMQVMKIEEDEDGTRHVAESSDSQVYTAQKHWTADAMSSSVRNIHVCGTSTTRTIQANLAKPFPVCGPLHSHKHSFQHRAKLIRCWKEENKQCGPLEFSLSGLAILRANGVDRARSAGLRVAMHRWHFSQCK